MEFLLKPFSELSTLELYQILQLRSEVFVIEQEILYQDMDNKDLSSHHLMGYQNGELVAYARLLPEGISYQGYCSIGRVCTKISVRTCGYGKMLMNQAIANCKTLFPAHTIKISGQSYLLRFYTELGFQAIGEEYLEDGIPHWAMIYQGKN